MGRCSAIKASGEPCRGVPVRGSSWCPAHHPDYQARRRAGASRGGRGSGGASSELAALKRQLQEIADGVLKGTTAQGRAAVGVQALNCKLRALEVERRWRELGEVEERLANLEKRLDPRSRISS